MARVKIEDLSRRERKLDKQEMTSIFGGLSKYSIEPGDDFYPINSVSTLGGSLESSFTTNPIYKAGCDDHWGGEPD